MFRAALAPFLANKTVAPHSYKWILYGDDDTFWFIDNVLTHLDQLDPNMPYLLSDNIWMKERGSGDCSAEESSCMSTSTVRCTGPDIMAASFQALATSNFWWYVDGALSI